MAKVYLETGDNFVVASNNTTVYGTTGTEKVTINSGVTGVTLDQNTETVVFGGASSAYTYKQAGNQILVYSSGVLVTTVPVQGDTDGTALTFSNGTVSAKLTSGVMSLGGATVSSTTAGAVTPTTIDTTNTSSGVGAGGNTPSPSFTLTAGTDSLSGTAASETWSAATKTLQEEDTIFDSSSSDSDTLNITATAADSAVPATITNVETINYSYSGVIGGAFDATNVKGATITGALTSALTDGKLTVTAAADNNVKAGTGVTNLTIDGLKSGAVDLGSATTAKVTTADISSSKDATNAILTVNADVSNLELIMNAGGSAAVTALHATKNATVTIATSSGADGYTASAGTNSLTTSGTGVVTIKASAQDLAKFNGGIKAGALTVSSTSSAATIDMSKQTLSDRKSVV